MQARAFAIFVFFLLGACATVPTNAPMYSRAPDPPASSGNVYIYRLGAYPTLRTPTIKIDDVPIFDPPEKAYTVVPIESGEREFVVNWAWDTGWPDLKFPLHVSAGSRMYIKISGSFQPKRGGFYEAGSIARLVPESQAEQELRACCRYIKPRAH